MRRGLALEAVQQLGPSRELEASFERVAVEDCHNSQAALLAGYCTTLARTNPEAALKTYRVLGYPFRIDKTGMIHLITACPKETDFLNIAANEIGEDDRTLALRGHY